jgi:acyl carrier protein
MNDNIENRIKNVVGAALSVPIDDINENSSADNIGNWDSLKQINLVLALEEEFQIEFSDDEIMNMNQYSKIANAIKKKL